MGDDNPLAAAAVLECANDVAALFKWCITIDDGICQFFVDSLPLYNAKRSCRQLNATTQASVSSTKSITRL
ncbi:hypothetical protein INT80_15430 [Gallibacterium anatis]|uniref:Uncharacterized protein n=1 Tax=Gallibacterium anatis TaxID=750 RepID=A0A930UXF4_9PAST|nr:hypothetical protein [Gallibacterium anatis]